MAEMPEIVNVYNEVAALTCTKSISRRSRLESFLMTSRIKILAGMTSSEIGIWISQRAVLQET